MTRSTDAFEFEKFIWVVDVRALVIRGIALGEII